MYSFKDRRSKPKSSDDILKGMVSNDANIFFPKKELFKADTTRSVAQVAKQIF